MDNMNSIQVDIRKLREEKNNVAQRVDRIKEKQVSQEVKTAIIEDDMELCKVKIDQLSGVVAYQDQVIQELNSKVEHMEVDKLRPNLVIQGIIETEREDCIQQAQLFFTNQLEITDQILIRKAYRIGKGKKRPLNVTLANPGDKATIYSYVSKLQGKSNARRGKYRIDDQLPPRLPEQKKRNRDMMWRNRNCVANKLAMSVKRGKLLVNNTPVQHNIKTPEASQLLKLKKIEVAALKDQKIVKGEPVSWGTSTFTGYVCDVQYFDEVNKAYEWVKFHNMDARHIICACKVPGNNIVNSQSYEDDHEHGARRVLLDYLNSIKLENRAVFVTRHYDGQHIGAKRFDLIIDAAKSAINHKPFNRLTGSFQFS